MRFGRIGLLAMTALVLGCTPARDKGATTGSAPPEREPDTQPTKTEHPTLAPAPKPSERPGAGIVGAGNGITLCLAIDRSGSMDESFKLRQAKAAVIAAARSLTKDDRIAVIAFGDKAEVILAPTPARDDAAVVAAVEGLTSAGHTVMFQALTLSYTVMRDQKTPIRHVVLVTDGVSSDNGKWPDLLAAMAADGITVSTVGIGLDVDAVKLARIAQWGKGRYFLALPHEVPQVVAQDTLRLVRDGDSRPSRDQRSAPGDSSGGGVFGASQEWKGSSQFGRAIGHALDGTRARDAHAQASAPISRTRTT